MFRVTDSSRAATQASVRLGYASGERMYQGAIGAIPEFPTLSFATFDLLDISAQELLVWPHRVTPEGYSLYLPELVKVSWGKDTWEFQVGGAGKPFVFPLREDVKQMQKESPGTESQLAVEVQLVAQTT